MPPSLFYEYAITPDVFDAGYISGDPRLEVILTELLKGISENGMVANLNKDGWIKHLENSRLPAVTALELKDRILRLLGLLKSRNRLVRHPKATDGDPAIDLAWLNLAMESHGHIQFDGIFTTKALLDSSGIACPELIDAQKALYSPQWGARRRTSTLQSCEPYYRPVLDPVLRHAKSLTIVDPYFSPHVPKYLDFLKICIDQMGRRGTTILPGRIHIHTGDPSTDNSTDPAVTRTVSDRLDYWERCLKTIYPSSIPHRIKVFLRKKKNFGKKFHDRFILTDQCCIEIPMGTDTFGSGTPHSTTWSMLDYDDMQFKAQEIDPPMGVYDLLGERMLAV